MLAIGRHWLCTSIGVLIAISGCESDAAKETKRQEAQRKWLELVEQGNDPFHGLENAALLARCFKKGEPAANYERILASGQKYSGDGITSYVWAFKVSKPPGPDATHYFIIVRIAGDPGVIGTITGEYSGD
jgi:hypothetical protein